MLKRIARSLLPDSWFDEDDGESETRWVVCVQRPDDDLRYSGGTVAVYDVHDPRVHKYRSYDAAKRECKAHERTSPDDVREFVRPYPEPDQEAPE